ncbi:MAG: YeeE/YedE family protein [Bdellovibrionales bacterium]
MDFSSTLYSLSGGALIGVAVTLMLLFNGRVTGISGIIASSLSKPSKEGLWRWMFLAGIIVGGLLMYGLRPVFFANLSGRGLGLVIVAGILVGYGTVMGSGCTSGHGVCGISRFSVRSVIATIVFMFFGFLAVQAVRYFLGG